MSIESSAEQPGNSSDAAELARLRAEIAEVRQQLQFNEQFLAAIFDQATYPIMVMDVHPDGHFESVKSNSAMYKMLGISATNATIDDFSPEMIALIGKRLQATLEANKTVVYEGQLKMRERTVWTRSLYSPIPGSDPAHRWVSIVAFDITEQKLREEEELANRERIIEQQAQSLNELSTPLLAINEQVVVLPLIGTIDSRRAQQIMETLLTGISESQAEIAIIDITGVSIVDTQVANAIIRAAQAAQLLGSSVVLTGIRPEIAQVMISLGVDLGNIVTRSTLQAGIAYSMQQ